MPAVVLRRFGRSNYKGKGAYGVGSMPNSLFTFKSSNPAVFTIDAKGVIHAKGEGSAKLTVTAKKKKSCKLVQTIYISDFVDEGAFMAADDQRLLLVA